MIISGTRCRRTRCPATLTRLDQLPRLSSGKPDRIAIRDLIMNDRDARVTP